uniref:Serine proteinase stubble-1 n=1 Tax=Locusta migratoria migratoria TaxID=238695 RepID=A0A4Y1PUE6_LOCMI|nr:serine proteinase stubble-1 [Locusta migratoria migratoria]
MTHREKTEILEKRKGDGVLSRGTSVYEIRKRSRSTDQHAEGGAVPRRAALLPSAPPPTPSPPTPPFVEPQPVTPTAQPPVDVPVGPVKSGCGVRRGMSPANDNATTFAEFPWMLVVQEAVYPGDGKPPVFIFKCGASLVHPQVALTAAHCLKRLIPQDVKVRAGIWDLTATAEPLPHQERRVIKIIRHPLFEEKTLFNDIALLVLDKTFDEALNVEVTCLPPPSVDLTGLRCIATGWGTSSPDTEIVQTTMKKVELPIVVRDRCENELRKTRLGRYFELHESFICAGGESNVDTCRGSVLHNTGYTEAVPAESAFFRKSPQEKDDDSAKLPTDVHNLHDSAYRVTSLYGSGKYKRHAGDGGGPLVCPITGDDGRYIQVGIVSWGIGCGGSRTPAVYASLSYFRDWVDKQLEDNLFKNIAIPPPSVEEDERLKVPKPTWG